MDQNTNELINRVNCEGSDCKPFYKPNGSTSTHGEHREEQMAATVPMFLMYEVSLTASALCTCMHRQR